MDNTEQDIIPIDGRVEDFRKHLEANPRTILSARFGDGKSFFLNQVIEKSKDDTTYIVVHPVHYQVSDNKDIFELVKRDILLQMIGLGMLPQDYEIPEHIIFSYYLQHNTTDIAKDLLSSLFKVLPNIATTTPIANSLGGFGGLGFSAIIEGIKSLRSNYTSFKGGLCKDTNKLLETFFKETDKLKNSPIESDAITALIRENIERWQKEEGKHVVLVFEDMDRLDPAHLFRIMNVLSAQIDANCTINEDPSGATKNRFGVDNVVLVLDYDNLKSIFHHFYGEKTDFSGYIHKFAPKGYFKYSVDMERHAYLMKELHRATSLTLDILAKISSSNEDGSKESLTSIFKRVSLRKAIKSMQGLESEISPKAYHKGRILSEGLLKLIIFLRRLMIDENEVSLLLQPLVQWEDEALTRNSIDLSAFSLSIVDIASPDIEEPMIYLNHWNQNLYTITLNFGHKITTNIRLFSGGPNMGSLATMPPALINSLFKYIYSNGSR